MYGGWIIFESIISFVEMFTSCFFAARIFRKKLEATGDIIKILIFSISGTALLTSREMGILPIPDYVPALLIFSLYSICICKGKIWSALLWALLNYMLIGVATLSTNSVLSLIFDSSSNLLELQSNGRILKRVVARLGQLVISEVIVVVMKRFRNPASMQKKDIVLVLLSIMSIILLMILWKTESYLTKDLLLIFNIFICFLTLIMNFSVLLFKEILSKEKYNNEELRTQNRIVSMQIRNQDEIIEIYNSMRSLKHDINAHLHTISGYLQCGEFEKANVYIKDIIGDVSRLETYHSGNEEIDALIGSKSSLAKKHGINLNIDMVVPEELKIQAKHLTVVLGNLYDNAIDANLKIEDKTERYIDIEITYKNNNLIIYFENAAKGEKIQNKGVWITTKKQKFDHGFGIKNIDRIVQMYKGYSQRELVDDKFICRIRIPDVYSEE